MRYRFGRSVKKVILLPVSFIVFLNFIIIFLLCTWSCVFIILILPANRGGRAAQLLRGCVGTSRHCLHLGASIYFGLLLWDSLQFSALNMKSCLLFICILILCFIESLMAMELMSCHIMGSQMIAQFLFVNHILQSFHSLEHNAVAIDWRKAMWRLLELFLVFAGSFKNINIQSR